MVRVLVVDDHRTVREVVEGVLRGAGLDVIGGAADGAEAVARSEDQRPDVIVMDLTMPVMDGIESTRHILESGTSGRVVVLTAASDSYRRDLAVGAGASAFLSKESASSLELVEAVRSGVSIPPRGDVRPDQLLGDRQVAILQLMADGASAADAAVVLNLSAKTVHNHLGAAYRRLGVQSNVHAVVAAARLGLIRI